VLPLAISLTTGDVILIIVFTTIPIALLTFVLGARNALNQIGKGQFAVEFDRDLPQGITDNEASATPESREAEIRQLLEAKAYRQEARGEQPVEVDAELKRLMTEAAPRKQGIDAQLVEEVKQLVDARNERRVRQGKEPLDVDAEVERQLDELENLGQ